MKTVRDPWIHKAKTMRIQTDMFSDLFIKLCQKESGATVKEVRERERPYKGFRMMTFDLKL